MSSDPTHVDNDLGHLFPPFAVKIKALLTAIWPEVEGKYPGLSHVGIYEGLRSPERQLWLYAQGRTRPGSIVTDDKIPRRHGLGGAVDIVGYDAHGNPSWDWPEAFWNQIQHHAHLQGLLSGLDWKGTLHDSPHVQMQDAEIHAHKTEMIAHLKALGLTVPNI